MTTFRFFTNTFAGRAFVVVVFWIIVLAIAFCLGTPK